MLDYSDASSQGASIPAGTIAPVHLTITPGGYNDPAKGWTEGWATQSETTGSVYLKGEFTILHGPHFKKKCFGLIGLHSPKGPGWGNMGRAFIRAMLLSANGLSDKDHSPQAQAALKINSFADLDGLRFVARIDVEKDANGIDKNTVKLAITADHKAFREHAQYLRPDGVAAPAAQQVFQQPDNRQQPAGHPQAGHQYAPPPDGPFSAPPQQQQPANQPPQGAPAQQAAWAVQ